MAVFALPLSAKVWISEFMADNDGSYLDEDGDSVDWLELFNDGAAAVDLSGWTLTDDALELDQWVFPNGTVIGPNQYLVVFASKKNRRIVGAPLHTNFSLKRSGEYLALVRPNGTTIEHDFGTQYPSQVEGISYGYAQTGGSEVVVPEGASGQAGVPLSSNDFDSNYQNWNSSTSTFSGASWRAVNAGVGFERSAGYGQWISASGNFESEMYQTNGSIFLRLPFDLSSGIPSQLTLRMRWDDGFIAYINGVEVASNNAPENPGWNSLSTAQRDDGQNDDYTVYAIDLTELNLSTGANVLAIHGLNRDLNSGDMLVYPEMTALTAAGITGNAVYFTNPTPAGINFGAGQDTVPPIVTDSSDPVPRPTAGQAIVVTAKVTEGSSSISQVRLFHRRMFEAESAPLMMNDSGVNGDALSGDGIYSAQISTAGMGAGEMVRWRIEAIDSSNVTTNAPAFIDPLDADQYYGTVTANTALNTSQLPILETFVEDEAAVDTRAGGRASVYYLGEFYDNVQMDLHGQSTAGPDFPKKSYDIDFNRGNRFLWNENERRVKDINLLTNWADKSKSRNAIAYEFLRRAGAGYHYAFPIRVERNGEFFSIVDLVEDGDDRYLDRIGLDENGALYKMYDRMVDPSTASKKTRQDEDTSDLSALIAGLNSTNNTELERRQYAYDHVDIPATINQLAAINAANITDTGHKNYYLYRDTEGTGEWRPLPWDVDLSSGRMWNSVDTYFDDDLMTQTQPWYNANPLWDLMHSSSEFRSMYLRRFSTLRENVLIRRNTTPDWYVDRLLELKGQLDPVGVNSDADLDYAKWGSWGNMNTAGEAIDRLINEYLPRRRNWLFSGARVFNGGRVPADAPAIPDVTIEEVDFLPASGDQEEEYFVLKNRENIPVDLSGWTLDGAVRYTFPAGTVIPNGSGSEAANHVGLLHVSMNSKSFRSRESGVTGGEFRFIVGGYSGQLSARGETIELRNEAGQLVATKTYTGTPTDGQEALRVTEINYHPAEPTVAESNAQPGLTSDDFEFVILRNITGTNLDLSGASFTDGINYTFDAGVSLAGGASLILVKNEAAFNLRYPSNQLPVHGPFIGRLSNDGEDLELRDNVGESILSFAYNDRWYPESDGLGATLALREDTTSFEAFGEPLVWGARDGNGNINSHFNAWQESQFAEALWETTGGIDENPDGDGMPNWQEYAFGTDPNTADEPLFQPMLIDFGGQTYLGAEVRRRVNGVELVWTLQQGDQLNDWDNVDTIVVNRVDHGDGTETVSLRSADPVGGMPRRFSRLRLTRN